MTDAPAGPLASTAKGRPWDGILRDPTPLLFALAIFTSAALVFVVQPMVSKLVLPSLGGSPSVWNTSMVFFQAALLGGYAYAHLLQRIRSIRVQLGVHLALLVLAALFLPLHINGLLGDPDPSAPIVWLLVTLVLSVGAPFAVLSATAPLLQAWYARVRVDQADGQNPYVLYAASNLGSFLALLSYPVLIEPLMTLSHQRISWSLGYGLFVFMVAGLGLIVWRRNRGNADPAPLPTSAPIRWRRRLLWVALAAVPSSLMLGVTAHLSTDVASAPFLWVIPLALYLLTFVIAFQARPWISLPVTLLMQGALVAVLVGMLPFRTGDWIFIFVMHLATFFFTTLMCHQILAANRPPPDRLTDFYLCMSLGGVVGGALTALVAPVVFDVVREYPLVLILAALFRPWGKNRVELRDWFWVMALVPIVLLPPGMLLALRLNPDLFTIFTQSDVERLSLFVLGAASICAFMIRDRALLFVAALAMITVSAHHVAGRYDWRLSERSFFGVMRVAAYEDPGMGGPIRMLMHGTTLHGAQASASAWQCWPTLYYAATTPIGQATVAIQRRDISVNIGVVGQGSGAMAAYKRADDTFTFFEIDPMVDRLSRDTNWFTYINGCADGPIRTVLGDARLTLAHEPAASYDLLVVDAFSSDAIPAHLLTREAIAEYLRVVKPNGVVVLHLSNRNLEIALPAVAASRSLGAHDQHQIFFERRDRPQMEEASTEALILSPTAEGLAEFRADPRWRTLAETDVKPWTDDYVNLFGALVRQVRMGG
jgi:SAM-dependent methyltransferase